MWSRIAHSPAVRTLPNCRLQLGPNCRSRPPELQYGRGPELQLSRPVVLRTLVRPLPNCRSRPPVAPSGTAVVLLLQLTPISFSFPPQLNGRKLATCQFLGVLTQEELALVYRNTLGTVLYSSNDCNPRILYESLLMNRPFFSTHETQIPANIQHLGHIIDYGAEDALEEFGLFVNAVDKSMWGERPRKFALEHLSEHRAYGEVLAFIEKQWGVWNAVGG